MSKITFEELMSEVEKLKKLSTKQLSEEQKQFILKARSPEYMIPVYKMSELWEKVGWGKISKTTLFLRIKEVLQEQQNS